jgi:predicted dehydrogenase
MQKLFLSLLLLALPLAAQEYKIAVVGLVHSHVWGHLGAMISGENAKLVGIAETQPELIAEAKKRGAANVPFYSDFTKMLDETKPDFVWAFVENNRHLAVVQACAPRKIHVMFEKPLASTYADSLAIQKLAKQHGIHILTNYQMAWWPSNYVAKTAVDSGTIEKPYRLRGVVGHGGPGNNGIGKFFFAWLTDPVKNGGGALMDFGCYNALWSLWYMGRPQTVYATAQHMRPDVYPKVEDNATLVLSYKNGVGIFEGSWNLPRSFQDLEVFGRGGSVYMQNGKVEVRKGRKDVESLPMTTLAKEEAEPIAKMVNAIRTKKPLEGMVALDINVGVSEIIEAAKQSVKTGKAVPLPLR